MPQTDFTTERRLFFATVASIGLAGCSDDGGSGTNTLLTTTLPEDGTYTIWVGSLSAAATREYALSLSEQ